MLGEDPPDLADDLGMVLAEVAGRDDLLGLRPRDVGAVVGHEAVRPIACRRVGPDRDDGVDLHRRRGGASSARPVRIGDPHSSSSMLVGRALRKCSRKNVGALRATSR